MLGASGEGITSRLGTWSGVGADWLCALRRDEREVEIDCAGAMDGACDAWRDE